MISRHIYRVCGVFSSCTNVALQINLPRFPLSHLLRLEKTTLKGPLCEINQISVAHIHQTLERYIFDPLQSKQPK